MTEALFRCRGVPALGRLFKFIILDRDGTSCDASLNSEIAVLLGFDTPVYKHNVALTDFNACDALCMDTAPSVKIWELVELRKFRSVGVAADNYFIVFFYPVLVLTLDLCTFIQIFAGLVGFWNPTTCRYLQRHFVRSMDTLHSWSFMRSPGDRAKREFPASNSYL